MWWILLLIYVGSVVSQWWYVHLAHSTNGRWSGLTPDSVDITMMIVPIVNTFVTIFAWVCVFPFPIFSDCDKFFKIK